MPAKIHLVGVNGAGIITAAAAAISTDSIASVAIDTQGFRFESITEIRDVNLFPGAVKYGDVPAILALCEPVKLAVAGESEDSVAVAKVAYSAGAASAEILPKSDDASAIVDWLLKQA